MSDLTNKPRLLIKPRHDTCLKADIYQDWIELLIYIDAADALNDITLLFLNDKGLDGLTIADFDGFPAALNVPGDIQATVINVMDYIRTIHKTRDCSQAAFDAGLQLGIPLSEIEAHYTGQFDSAIAFTKAFYINQNLIAVTTYPLCAIIDWPRAADDLMANYVERHGFYFKKPANFMEHCPF